MRKETFKKVFVVYDSLMEMNGESFEDVNLEEEIDAMKEALLEIAEDGLDGEPRKFRSEREIQEYMSGFAKCGIMYEEPRPAQHSDFIAWSQKDHEIYDIEHMGMWPTWDDGKLVRIGERAVSMRGPLEIEGVEVDGKGYILWGFVDMGETDDVTGNPLKTRYIIDCGKDERSHPVREGEYCDFWPESEEDALAYYGKEVLYRNTGRAHLLEEDDE